MDLRAAVRRHLDLLLACFVAVLYVVELALRPHTDLAGAIPLALLASGALALRRRAPLPAFLVAIVANYYVLHFASTFDANSISFVLVFFVSLYSLGRHARGKEAWLGVVAVAGTVVAFVVGDGAHRPSDVFFALAFCGTPWAAGVAVRLRREREAVLTAHNERLRREQEEAARRAVATERARIARELHDVVSHAIAVTVLQARGARKMVGGDDTAVRRALDAIEQTNTAALSDMRRLLAVLRDTDTDPAGRTPPQPSLAHLDALVAQVRDSGLPVEVQLDGRTDAVPPGVDLSAYRIIQEALTNALKHAGPGASATVRVRFGADDLEVAVSDDGTLPAAGPGTGNGLVGIRERVAVVGGDVQAGPRPEGGYQVRVRLPYTVDA